MDDGSGVKSVVWNRDEMNEFEILHSLLFVAVVVFSR